MAPPKTESERAGAARGSAAVAGVAGAIAVACSLATALVPPLHLAYVTTSAHVAIETAAAVVALLAAELVRTRFVLSRRRRDLLLTIALLCLGLTNLFFAALPAIFDAESRALTGWAPLAARLLAAALFALAVTDDREVAHPRRALRRGLAGTLALLGGLAGLAALLGPHLPHIISPGEAPRTGLHIATPSVAVAQALAALGFAVAAVGFLRHAEREHDAMLRWFGVGSVLAAVASLDYMQLPSLYSGFISIGDLLRLGFYTALVGGAARELERYQRALALEAVQEERLRLARELHDGVAQELAFLAARARGLTAGNVDSAALESLADAAVRALDESRGAISALREPDGRPFEEHLANAAVEFEHREGARLRYLVPQDLDPPARTREALMRILREAVTNAVRHADASEVLVEVSHDGPLRLRIRDNGRGFDPAQAHGGYGLAGMRERARALGGDLRLSSQPGSGTEIEVVLP